MGANGLNEKFAERLKLVEDGHHEIRSTLISALNGLSHSIDMLAKEVSLVTKHFKTAIPIRLVALMFGIMVAALFGIESIKTFFKWIN